MKWAAQGLEKLRDWKDRIGTLPLVAIGGINTGRIDSVFAHGADSAAGKKLYDANCAQCLTASVHTRPDHKIKSLAALDKQLTGCSAGAHMNLSDADRANVEQYLNEQFYKFQ